MLRKIFIPTAPLLLMFVVYLTSCKPERDTIDPVILLDGANPYNVDSIGGNFKEPGFTAVDENDGDITNRVTVQYPNILADSSRSYQAFYTVKDNVGNVFTTYRTINIRNSAAKLEGSYIHDTLTCPDSAAVIFQSTIETSPTVNGDFSILNFANEGQNAKLRGHWENGNLTWFTPDSLHDADTSIVHAVTSGLLLLNPTRFEIDFKMTVGTLPDTLRCKVKMYP